MKTKIALATLVAFAVPTPAPAQTWLDVIELTARVIQQHQMERKFRREQRRQAERRYYDGPPMYYNPPGRQYAQTPFDFLFGQRPVHPRREAMPQQPDRSVRYEPLQSVQFDPRYDPNQIIISFSDRRLYYIIQSGVALSYPIAVPRPEDRWAGTLPVSDKKVNPPWRPTEDMKDENPDLPDFVPGGHPRNPLGVRALYLGKSLYRIHGTDAPWTIGTAASKGCIRMLNEHVIDLYDRTEIGTNVTVTYERFAQWRN